MARDRLPKNIRLASGQQLWRLNQLGLLELPADVTDEVEPVIAADAEDVLGRALAHHYPGLSRFPRSGEIVVVDADG